jgi:hypothetical protein
MSKHTAEIVYQYTPFGRDWFQFGSVTAVEINIVLIISMIKEKKIMYVNTKDGPIFYE